MDNTYIQPSEFLRFYPNGSEFTSAQVSESLWNSFSLVNSYLKSSLRIPAYTDEGEAPAILKVMQGKFATYLLEFGNHGWTEENENLFRSTADTLSKITQNELLVSEIQKTTWDIGWVIKNMNIASGSVFVQGEPPTYVEEFTFTVSDAAETYEPTFTIVRSDSAATYDTLQVGREWEYVEDTNLGVRVIGKFYPSESFTVRGTPTTKEIVSSKPSLLTADLIWQGEYK